MLSGETTPLVINRKLSWRSLSGYFNNVIYEKLMIFRVRFRPDGEQKQTIPSAGKASLETRASFSAAAAWSFSSTTSSSATSLPRSSGGLDTIFSKSFFNVLGGSGSNENRRTV